MTIKRLNISVAMATYNGERFLKEQIDSILKQLNDNDELVISYNESSDNTLEILKDYLHSDKRVKLFFCNEKNVVKNFQNALIHCKNSIIFFSDQDDVWCPGKVDAVLEQFENPNITVVVHDTTIVDSDLKPICESSFHVRGGSTSIIKNLIRLSYIGCAMAFRAELKNIIVPIPTKERSHDWWTGTICSMFGKMALIPQPYILHRMHENNATPKKRPGLRYQVKVRWLILSNLIVRCIKNRTALLKVKCGTPFINQINQQQ